MEADGYHLNHLKEVGEILGEEEEDQAENVTVEADRAAEVGVHGGLMVV